MPRDGSPLGTATRLLVLGAVRIFQPVHGYFLRRELESWEIGSWASTHPGSIYHALRTLAERGLLTSEDPAARGARPARTAYRLTDAGLAELDALERRALVATDDPSAFLVALTWAFALPRADVLELLDQRIEALAAGLAETARKVEAMLAEPATPGSATVPVRAAAARVEGELAWCREFVGQVRAGAHAFAGEPPDWLPTQAQIDAVRAAGAQVPASVVAAGTRPA